MDPSTKSGSRPRRFWKSACAGPKGEQGYPVLLDGRGARTPAGSKLTAPTEGLAIALATEWAAQGEELDFDAMPLTRLAFTAIDRTPAHRGAIAEEVARFAGSDVLCYFAEAPQDLIQRESEGWEPVLTWAESSLGVRLERTSGIIHRAQPPQALERVRVLASELDDFRLTGLASASALFASAVLAFALERRKLDGATAFELSRLDETFQAERWGEDAQAAERTAGLRRDAVVLGRWFAALAGERSGGG